MQTENSFAVFGQVRKIFGMLVVAYDRLGKFSWKYLNGILENWHKKGLHTAAEITAVEPNLRQPIASKQPQNPSPPTNNGNLADWERDWLAEFHAMTKEDNAHGV